MLDDLHLGDLLPLAGSEVVILRRLRLPVRHRRRAVARRVAADADVAAVADDRHVSGAHDGRRLGVAFPESFLASVAFAFVAWTTFIVTFRFVTLE